MKQKITEIQIKATYEVAKHVYAGELENELGAKQLNEQHRMNLGSALDYIRNFRHLMNGSVFHRTMNVFATDYYFTRIKDDFGNAALDRAITAVREHIKYYEGLGKSKVLKLRGVVTRHSALLDQPIDLDEYQNRFLKSVEKSFQEPAETRRERLKTAAKRPEKKATISEVFIRNPDVAAEVLHRADGACERCRKPAPFLRIRDQSPYLEVHHKIQLAHGGEGTTDNAIALCPNCHRELHFGSASKTGVELSDPSGIVPR